MTERLSDGEISTGTCNNSNCPDHYHAEDPIFTNGETRQRPQPMTQPSTSSGEQVSNSTLEPEEGTLPSEKKDVVKPGYGPDDHGFRRIIRNFTPSYVCRCNPTSREHKYDQPLTEGPICDRWFIITMATGVVSVLLHQLPYNGDWLQIISVIFFVLNISLFILFTFISCLRYMLHLKIFPAILRHPHQSLFLATFPVGLATLIIMITLVCAPVWGHGMATFAWVLWWIDSLLALSCCFHLTYVMSVFPILHLFPSRNHIPASCARGTCLADLAYRMSNRRSELAEMTALYLIPVVSVVMAANSGGIVAGAIPNPKHQLWTLIISYIFWGIGSPLSWIILTIYFLRLTLHKPLSREVIVSLLLPIGPLGLSGFS
jgi:tellurite resistance protein TehA-like permease